MELSNFQLIPTALPPMLSKMIGVPENKRYFAICYYGSKAIWSTRQEMSTFSFYGVYEPLINHIALSCYLWNYHLGSDDEYPTHQILCDQSSAQMYIGESEQVEKFLSLAYPPNQQKIVTKENLSQIKAQIEQQISKWTRDDYNRQGMFEIFGRISPKLEAERVQLVQWLDRQVTKQLIEQYADEARKGNYNAINALRNLQHRLKLTQQLN